MAKHNFTDTMDRAKIAAQVNRNRGLHVGKQAKGWGLKRYKVRAEEGWHRTLGMARVQWSNAKGDALEEYCRAAFPERYEGWPVL